MIPSVVESVGRGGIALSAGAMGDAREMRDAIQSKLPKSLQNVSNIAEFMASPTSKVMQQIAPTSQQTLNAMPRINPDYQGSQQHEMVGGLVSPAMPYLLRAGAKAMQNVPIGNMIAYHGTPHEIQGAFDLKKVGTGQGAQSYGHGMYFAEAPAVAKIYQAALSDTKYKVGERELKGNEAWAAQFLHDFQDDALPKRIDVNTAINKANQTLKDAATKQEIINNIKALDKAGLSVENGNLYKVDIPDEHIPMMLDWDKPLNKQSELIQNVANQLLPKIKQTSPNLDINKIIS
jgi:hypothetical protein